MSKSIKVSQTVYEDLLVLQLPRETFSEEISRLLQLAALLRKAEPIIRGQHEFLKWQLEKREQEKAAHG